MISTQMEVAGNELQSRIDGKDLLLDLKVLIKEYYFGSFTDDGQSLVMKFFNGQKFALRVEELA